MVSVVRCWKAEYQKCKHSILLYMHSMIPIMLSVMGWTTPRKAERFMWMFRVTTVSWKFQSQTRERGFLKRHYATHRNGSIWAIKAAIQSYTLVWVYILQIRLWNNIMVSLF